MSLMSYILIYKSEKNYEGQYINLEKAMNLLQKYKVYIFKFSKNYDILYLNYPLKYYYNSSKINIIDDNKEENIKSFEYFEVRLIDKFPSIRIGINMKDL